MSTRMALTAGLLGLAMAQAGAATITIVNLDSGTGVGFDDATPATPIAGNTGTTLGEQRLIVFQRAAEIWGALLQSAVEIKVDATFAPITNPACTSSFGVLGQAGPKSTARFDSGPGLPTGAQAGVAYPIALANALSGVDQNGSTAEISAQFNSDVDNDVCLGGTHWWYGTDPAAFGSQGGDRPLLPVVLHEMAHGLGFITTTCLDPGGCSANFPYGSFGAASIAGDNTITYYPDPWAEFLFDVQTGKSWATMSDAERGASSLNDPDLVWAGSALAADAASLMQTGDQARHASTGQVRMHAPSSYQAGSTASHFTKNGLSAGVEANGTIPLLMRPSLSNAVFDDPDLTTAVLQDIGWTVNNLDVGPTVSASTPASGSQTSLGGGVVGGQVSGSITFTTSGGSGAGTTSLSCTVSSGTVSITSGGAQTLAVGDSAAPVGVAFTLTAGAQTGVVACSANDGNATSNFSYTFTASAGITVCTGDCVLRSGFEPGEGPV